MATSARNDLMRAVNLVVSTTLAAGAALAQTFPSKPLQIITTQAGCGSDFMSRVVVQALARPDVKERFFAAGVETAGSSPKQLAATVKPTWQGWGKASGKPAYAENNAIGVYESFNFFRKSS